jgi:2-oxoglutarate ferredoxin oxidoreductase subunit delta
MKFWRTPLDSDKIHIRKGNVIIIEDRCKGCDFCIAYCPRKVLAMSTAFNVKGYHFPFLEAPDRCVGCHFCEALCPEFAIYVAEPPEET